MDGVVAVRQLLAAYGALTAVVPSASIVAGVLPTGTALPAIAIKEVSATDQNIPSPGVKRRVSARIEVQVFASDYPTLREIVRLVKKAAADQMPTVTGISEVTIRTANTGPDFMDDEAKFYIKSQDFWVGYNELT